MGLEVLGGVVSGVWEGRGGGRRKRGGGRGRGGKKERRTERGNEEMGRWSGYSGKRSLAWRAEVGVHVRCKDARMEERKGLEGRIEKGR